MEKQLKILAVSTSDTAGGAARAAYRIHKGLRLMNVDSHLFVKNKYSKDDTVISLSDFIPENKFNKAFSYIQHKFKNKIQHHRWNKYPDKEVVFLSDLRSVSLFGALQKFGYDILHVHWFNLRFLNINELTKIQKPIVWTLHDSWAFTGICHIFHDCDKYEKSCGDCPLLHSGRQNDLSRKIWFQKKRVYNNLNLHIVTPSQWLADAVAKSSLLKRFPVTVIPNGLDTDKYSPGDKVFAREKFGLLSSGEIILFGAVNPDEDKNKGFSKLLEAIQCLEEKKIENITLAVFGTDKPIDFSTRIPIHYLGYLNTDEEIVQAYQAADVMVVPSLSETFGQTASEAMACGTPVVAFNCTGIKEVVDHKITGYLSESYSSADLANGIVWCLNNNAEKVLSVAARKKAIDKYSLNVVAVSYKALYEKLL